MPQFINAIGSGIGAFLDQPLVKAILPLLTLVLGWYGRKYLDYFKWRRRQFLSRLNVSLNTVEDGTLKIRTVFEKSLDEIFLNTYATGIVAAAGEKTTPDDPIVPLPESETWHILNSLLNAVAEEFKEGAVRRDMGLPVRVERYYLCLTREKADDIKQDKLRAMMIKQDLLKSFPKTDLKLESPHHSLRVQTLRQMAAALEKRPQLFRSIEICLSA